MEFKDLAKELIKEDSDVVSRDFNVPGYPELPTDDSPKEIVRFLRRFVEDHTEEEIKNSILLYEILGGSTPKYKMSREASEYTDNSSGEQKCSNCEFLYEKVNEDGDENVYICSQIRGEIKPEGWCNQWEEVD